ncbi:hypothetical protein GEMRC1_002341 [Eukaryota sp. GEM-RC1]
MFPNTKIILLYIGSIVVFVGLNYVFSTYLLFLPLRSKFDVTVIFWESSLPYILLLFYGSWAIPHALVSYIVLRQAVFRMLWGTSTLFYLAIVQATFAITTSLIARNRYKLDFRRPKREDIVAYVPYIFVGPFIAYWFAILWVHLIEDFPITILEGVLIWMTVSSFTFALIAPFFGQILYCFDHLILKYTPYFASAIPSQYRTSSMDHGCFYCIHPPFKEILMHLVIIIVSGIYFGLLLWVSAIDSPFYQFVLVPFGFIFLYLGFRPTVTWLFSLFIVILLMAVLFGVELFPGIGVTFFSLGGGLLVLFAAINSDDLRRTKKEVEDRLKSKVDRRTQQLEVSRNHLAAFLDTISKLPAGISHEIKTSLNHCVSSLEILCQDEAKCLHSQCSRPLHGLHFLVDDLLFKYTNLDLTGTSSLNVLSLVESVSNSLILLIHDVHLEYYETSFHSFEYIVSSHDLGLTKLFQFMFRQLFWTKTRVIMKVSQQLIDDSLLFSFSGEDSFNHLTSSRVGRRSSVDASVVDLLEMSHQLADSLGFTFIHSFNPDSGHLVLELSFSSFVIEKRDRSEVLSLISDRFSSFAIHSLSETTRDYLCLLLSPILSLVEDIEKEKDIDSDRNLIIIDENTMSADDIDRLLAQINSKKEGGFPIFIGNSFRRNCIAQPLISTRFFNFFNRLLSTSASHDLPPVLVVDDNKMNVKLLQALLRSQQLASDSAFDGEEAFLRCKKRINEGNPYFLILMDILMPKMDGVEATKLIRAFERTFQIQTSSAILAVSAHAEANSKIMDDVRSVGFNEFVSKPLKLSQLKHFLVKYGIS